MKCLENKIKNALISILCENPEILQLLTPKLINFKKKKSLHIP